MENIKVLIVDDMKAHRNRIKRAVKKSKNIEVIGEAVNGYEAILKTIDLKPDIVLMDVEMENKDSGILAAKEINKKLPDIKIIMLTSHTEEQIIYAAFQSGIVDYLPKDCKDCDLILSIENTHINASSFQPIIAEKVRKEFKKMKDQEENFLYLIKLISELTSSEFYILRLLIEGKKREEISKIRFVEIGTLKKQISSILKKCKRSSTKELVSDLKEMNISQIINKL